MDGMIRNESILKGKDDGLSGMGNREPQDKGSARLHISSVEGQHKAYSSPVFNGMIIKTIEII